MLVCSSWIRLAIGGVLGLLFRAVTYPSVTTSLGSAQPTNSGWTPVVIGIVIGGILALVGILYSLTAGAKLVLRTSGAVPAAAQYQQLHDVVEALAIGEGIPKPAVYVIDDPSPNAFATGVSPDKAAITYTTGLFTIMNREELEGVTSHEMSHIKNHDIRLLLVVSTMIGLAALLASILWRTAFWGSIGDENNGGDFAVSAFRCRRPARGPRRILRSAHQTGPFTPSRTKAPTQAGWSLPRNPVGLLNALKKLQQNDKPFKKMNHATAAMCIDDPLQHHEGWYHRLYDTHPPIEDRIAELEKIASGQKV